MHYRDHVKQLIGAVAWRADLVTLTARLQAGRYRAWNGFGPTVFSEPVLDDLIRIMVKQSRNAGAYRLVDQQTGRVVAVVCDGEQV